MYCNKCGAEISDRAFFCKHCGNMMRDIVVKPKDHGAQGEERKGLFRFSSEGSDKGMQESAVATRVSKMVESMSENESKIIRDRTESIQEEDIDTVLRDDSQDALDSTSTFDQIMKEQKERARLKAEMAVAKANRATEQLEKARNKATTSYENMSLSEAIIDDTSTEAVVDENVAESITGNSFLAEEPAIVKEMPVVEEESPVEEIPLVEEELPIQESNTIGINLGDEIKKAELKAEKKRNKKEKRAERNANKSDRLQKSFAEESSVVKEEDFDKTIDNTDMTEVASIAQQAEQANVMIDIFQDEEEETGDRNESFIDNSPRKSQVSVRNEIINKRKKELQEEREAEVKAFEEASADAAKRASRRMAVKAEIRRPVESPVVVDTKAEKIDTNGIQIIDDAKKEELTEIDSEKTKRDKKDLSYPVFTKITVGGVIASVIVSIFLFLCISGLTMVCSIRSSVMTENVQKMSDKLKLQEKFEGTYVGELIDFSFLTQIISDNFNEIMVVLFASMIIYLIALLLRINIANQKLVLLYIALPCIFSGSILYEASANYSKFSMGLCDLLSLPEEIVIIICELVATILGRISLFVVCGGIVLCALLVILIIIDVATAPDRAGNQDRMDRVFGQ